MEHRKKRLPRSEKLKNQRAKNNELKRQENKQKTRRWWLMMSRQVTTFWFFVCFWVLVFVVFLRVVFVFLKT